MEKINLKSNHFDRFSNLPVNNSNRLIQKYLSRDSIVELVTKFQLYYHVSLSYYAYETLLDYDETQKKIMDLKLNISSNKMLFLIYTIVLKHKNEIDFHEKIEYYLRKEALLHSLNDFVNSDKELFNYEKYVEYRIKMVVEDKFFNDSMYEQFEANYATTYIYYDRLITNKYLQKFLSKVKSLKSFS